MKSGPGPKASIERGDGSDDRRPFFFEQCFGHTVFQESPTVAKSLSLPKAAFLKSLYLSDRRREEVSGGRKQEAIGGHDHAGQASRG